MEDLVERCRAATGKAAADLVDEATAAPGVLVFGELLDLEGVQALASDPSLASTLAQLRVREFIVAAQPRGDGRRRPGPGSRGRLAADGRLGAGARRRGASKS